LGGSIKHKSANSKTTFTFKIKVEQVATEEVAEEEAKEAIDAEMICPEVDDGY